MKKDQSISPLLVRLEGPAVHEGRIALSDLAYLGNQLQAAVDRVARLLTGDASSLRRGQKRKEIRDQCALEVVALDRGCVELALDFPKQQQLPIVGLGRQAVEQLLDGIPIVEGDSPDLPAGYDTGVLLSWREIGSVFQRGITSVAFELNGMQNTRRSFVYTPKTRSRVIERIQAPITNRRVSEGRLLMADFKDRSFKCRLHPPAGNPIPCTFDESTAKAVYDALRKTVRITGEAATDSQSGEIISLKIRDLEVLPGDDDSAPEQEGESDFWESKTIEMLAQEQGVRPVERLEDILGKGASLWEDDSDFNAFVSGIYERRHQEV